MGATSFSESWSEWGGNVMGPLHKGEKTRYWDTFVWLKSLLLILAFLPTAWWPPGYLPSLQELRQKRVCISFVGRQKTTHNLVEFTECHWAVGVFCSTILPFLDRLCQIATRRLLFFANCLCRLKTALMELVLNSILRFHINSFSKHFELAANSIGCSYCLCQHDAVKKGYCLSLSLLLYRNKHS